MAQWRFNPSHRRWCLSVRAALRDARASPLPCANGRLRSRAGNHVGKPPVNRRFFHRFSPDPGSLLFIAGCQLPVFPQMFTGLRLWKTAGDSSWFIDHTRVSCASVTSPPDSGSSRANRVERNASRPEGGQGQTVVEAGSGKPGMWNELPSSRACQSLYRPAASQAPQSRGRMYD